MIPLINFILFQLSPFESFQQWLFPTPDSSNVFEILPSYANLMLVIVILGGFFLVIRVYYNYKKFPIPETRIDTYHFHVQDYFYFSANLSRDEEPLMESTLQVLDTIPEIAEGVKYIREWVGKKQLFIYQGIYKDNEHAINIRGEGSTFTMVSTVDLDNPDYYTIDKKGRFDWGTLRKEHHRQMICLMPSVRRDGTTVDGNERDVWFVYPMFKPKIGGTKVFQSDIKQLVTNKIEVTMSIIDPSQTIKIASIFDWLVPLKRMQETLNELDRNDKLTEGMVKKAYHIAGELKIDGDIARSIAARNPVYSITMQPKKPFADEPILWLIITVMGAFVGAKLPSMIDQLRNTDPSILALLGGGMVVAIYLIMTSKKKEKEKTDMEKVEQSEDMKRV